MAVCGRKILNGEPIDHPNPEVMKFFFLRVVLIASRLTSLLIDIDHRDRLSGWENGCNYICQYMAIYRHRNLCMETAGKGRKEKCRKQKKKHSVWRLKKKDPRRGERKNRYVNKVMMMMMNDGQTMMMDGRWTKNERRQKLKG